MFSLLILHIIIQKRLIRSLNMNVNDDDESKEKYVNNIHRYGEKTLNFLILIIITITIIDYHEFRVFIFISMAILFAFRTYIEWKHIKGSLQYLLSATSIGLCIIGAVVYSILDHII
ncbi:DUF4181 domain-containing protein [Virgibacillus dokdonensis]|uniref:DUF4181 domain-containing protein n=1 Tax=Virgibacillus dokdonensis TaxID=302167 RepID=A0ABU7VCJ8_9BACI